MLHRIFADNKNKKSVASQLRQKRFQLFIDMLDKFPTTVNILDVGGTQDYWKMMTNVSHILDKIKITLLNLHPEAISMGNFTSVAGDARSMTQFSDN